MHNLQLLMSKNTLIKILLNTLLGVILVVIWLKFVNIGEILSTISTVKVPILAIALFFMFVSAIVRSIRLKIFLSPIKKIRLPDLIFLTGVATLLNFFIPIRAGEIAKGVYLNTHYQLDLGKSVIWIFLDRFVDFLAVLFLAAILFFLVPTSLNITFITIIIVILSVGLILTYLAIFRADYFQKVANFLRVLLIEKHIKLYFDRFSKFILQSFAILNRHPKDLVMMVLITFLAYASDGAVWYFTFISLGATQNYLQMYLGQLLSALTYLIPAAPGYIGSAEASGLAILSGVFGMDSNLASSMIVLFHLSSAVFVIVYGIISVYGLKIDLGLILKKALKRG